MSNEERELRDALQARAETVPVGRADETGLLRRLAGARRRRRQTRLAAVAAALVVALAAASLVTSDDPDRENVVAGPDPSSTTTLLEPSTTVAADAVPVETTPTLPAAAPTSIAPGTSAVPGTTTTVPPTITTRAPLPPVPDDAVWPPPGSTTTFTTSDRAASDFARRFLGMATPQMGAGRPTAAGTDAIDVRPLPNSTLATTILLRRVEGRGWVVTGCNTPGIVIDQPAAGATIASPLTVRGRAQAFEGHVDVEVRADGATTPVGKWFGTGASDQLSPYESTVAFSRPAVPRGTIVVSEPRADDAGRGPLAVTVIRIAF